MKRTKRRDDEEEGNFWFLQHDWFNWFHNSFEFELCLSVFNLWLPKFKEEKDEEGGEEKKEWFEENPTLRQVS